MFLDTKPLQVDDLRLDPDNPRLPSSLERTPEAILQFLAESSSIDELISAIGANGYFDSEPLIGVPTNEGSYIIVEGNRRLTALKLLAGEKIAEPGRRIRDALEIAEYRPEQVPVALYESRTDVLNYLGNKHIAGVKPWGALAKARYARQLFANAPADLEYSEKIRHVARMIGSRSDFIGRALKALDAYNVAESNAFFALKGVDEDTVKFSLLGTALDYEGIQNYVYVDAEKSVDQRELIEEHVKNLFSWMFEKDDRGRTRVGESRNLSQLSKVVAHAGALDSFVKGTSLEQAFRLTDGINEEFDSLTITINSKLRDANSIAAEVDFSDDRLGVLTSIARQARNLRNSFEEND